MNNKYICIHGHFYQPPRENAWLETIEHQDSAAPFHDWNERINRECYSTNAAARILDSKSWITKISNNYNRISFNFGPTLLSWLEQNDPETYGLIQKADVRSRELFGGHGNALAQVHSHLIMPLCSPRDKITQVQWGIRDFEHRFGRFPEGMWLAEAAVDTETLEVLAAHGIAFTVLAPRQAKSIKKVGTDTPWLPVNEDTLDTSRPYWCNLPSGRRIAIFFYNGNISKAVAFERLLNSGKGFASRLLSGFRDDNSTQLVHIATDGESYGHHHRFGEMALADALYQIETNTPAKLINYGQYLELFPPEWEAEIHDNSSWSCVHGIERWRNDCGCNGGGPNAGHQAWRAPLRDALDWLRDQLVQPYEYEMSHFVHDVWQVRNQYIDVLLERNDQNIQAFITKHCKRRLAPQEEVHFLRLLEMQRQAILMYTSCGWFFDEISGIETNQILQYALRAMDYAEDIFGIKLHARFDELLAKAPSNVHSNGAVCFELNVVPTRVSLKNVAMHFAVASLFEEQPFSDVMFNYSVAPHRFEKLVAGQTILTLGQLKIRSSVTHFERSFYFAALYMGQHHIIGNLSMDMTADSFEQLGKRIKAAFHISNLGEMINIMQEHFGAERFTISNLFYDQKRDIISRLTGKYLDNAGKALEDTYNSNYAMMQILEENKLPLPPNWKTIAGQVLRQRLLNFLKDGTDLNALAHMEQDCKRWKVQIQQDSELQFAASERMLSLIVALWKNTENASDGVNQAIAIAETLQKMKLEVDFGRSQNYFFLAVRPYRKGIKTFESPEWGEALQKLAQLLRVHIGTNTFSRV
jgi:alpha-amylase/alpha-mannosidase (GH57 family)